MQICLQTWTSSNRALQIKHGEQRASYKSGKNDFQFTLNRTKVASTERKKYDIH